MATPLGAQLGTFDLETVTPTNSGNPKGHMHGLRVAYGSATTITIEAGEARDSTDTYDLTLAALVTVSIATAGAALGLDETTLSANCTTSGSTTGTMSASIWIETPMTNTVKTLTGTITSSGTAITGSGTLFLSGNNGRGELAVGDVLRSASNGAVRITAITSDTAATAIAAFPGGDIGAGQAITAYENLTFWCDTAQSGDKRAVNTITHDGLTVTWTTNSTSNGAGRTAKIGVEIASRTYYPWIVYGGSGTTGILSTQRTRPYNVTGYTTAWRRVPVAQFNNSSGNLDIVHDRTGTGNVRDCSYDEQRNSDHYALTAGAATSFTAVAACPAIPPTARAVRVTMVLTGSTVASGSAQYLVLRPRGGAAATDGEISAQAACTTTLVAQSRNADWLTMNGSQAFDYYIAPAAASGTPAYVVVGGWLEAS